MYPKQSEIQAPLLAELAKRGGSARPSDLNGAGRSVYDALVDYFNLSTEARERVIMERGRPRSKWNNVVRWTKEGMKRDGLVVAPKRGLWELTDLGRRALADVEKDEAGSAGGSSTAVDLATFLKRKKEAERIGHLGEELVLQEERDRLEKAGRVDLAGKVRHTAVSDVGAGYDVLSFELDGTPRYIEVKTTRSDRSAFEITANEVQTARDMGEAYWLYRVSRIESDSPTIQRHRNLVSLLDANRLSLTPTAYRATWNELDDAG